MTLHVLPVVRATFEIFDRIGWMACRMTIIGRNWSGERRAEKNHEIFIVLGKHPY